MKITYLPQIPYYNFICIKCPNNPIIIITKHHGYSWNINITFQVLLSLIYSRKLSVQWLWSIHTANFLLGNPEPWCLPSLLLVAMIKLTKTNFSIGGISLFYTSTSQSITEENQGRNSSQSDAWAVHSTWPKMRPLKKLGSFGTR